MLADMPKLFGAAEARRARTEARRVARTRASIDVTIASAQGPEMTVIIRDISAYGCSIGPSADWMKPGGFVSLRPRGEAGVTGIVRWIRDGAAGIEFVRPLSLGGGGLAGLIEDEG